MKLILSSCDFINQHSHQVIIDNIPKPLADCKVLFIPNEKATPLKIKSNKYYDRLKENGFTNINNIYIFDETRPNDFRNLKLDLIYVSGGNTFGTMKKIKDTKFDLDIKKYILNGVIYIGGSCGAHIVTSNIKHVLNFDDNNVDLINFTGLNLFPGLLIPHYTKSREKILKELLEDNNVYALTDDETIVFEDNNITRC